MSLKTILPFDDDVKEILGRPNFRCHHLARALRELGWDIPTKAEAEQAAVIYWLLDMKLTHGAEWRKSVNDVLVELDRANEEVNTAELERALGDAAHDPQGNVQG